jgi:hypothetical protein
MGSTQDFWDLLRKGGPVQPAEGPSTALYEARAEAKSFATALRLGKMTLEQVYEAIGVGESEAARLAAFAKAHPEELPVVETANTFRRLVAQQLGKLLRGGAK